MKELSELKDLKGIERLRRFYGKDKIKLKSKGRPYIPYIPQHQKGLDSL